MTPELSRLLAEIAVAEDGEVVGIARRAMQAIAGLPPLQCERLTEVIEDAVRSRLQEDD